MKYIKLRNSNIEISQIGLGTWAYSNDVWGPTDEAQAINTIHYVIDSGVNLIDTAPIYGYGHSETIVGKSIKNRRNKVFLATKCGLIGRGKNITHNLSRKSILKEIDDSLSRLQTDYIDLYQCHWPDANTPLSETMEVLNEIKKSGKIRFIGVSNFNSDQLAVAEKYSEITTLQVPIS